LVSRSSGHNVVEEKVASGKALFDQWVVIVQFGRGTKRGGGQE
jgi:hypothetical protein